MKIYVRKIDKQFIEKQVSYTKEILRDFLDNKSDHDVISIESDKTHQTKDVSLLLATDPRFDNNLQQILAEEGAFEINDLMILFKLKNRYIIKLVKSNTEEFNVLNSLFADGDRHLLLEEKDIKLDVAKLKPRSIIIHPLNSILYGAPGTGKTYSTAEYAIAIIENREIKEEPRVDVMNKYNKLLNEGRIVFTTFHQNYSYEDFIQGLRPQNNEGVLEFITRDGVFKNIAQKALNDGENNYVIIIDEINRANISRVFGELITLIEEDKRWGEINGMCVTLPSGDKFVVPNNLYIIGTMNTADKSISLIDAALRRRFEFIEQKIDSLKVDDESLREILNKINKYLVDHDGNEELLIGHAYFMNKTIGDLEKIMNQSIIPLLYEYCLDNKKKVSSLLKSVLEGTEYLVDESSFGRLRVIKK